MTFFNLNSRLSLKTNKEVTGKKLQLKKFKLKFNLRLKTYILSVSEIIFLSGLKERTHIIKTEIP